MGLVDHLRNGQQCDEEGVMCIVSRQACHEAADKIEKMEIALKLALELSEVGLVDFEEYGLSSDTDISEKYRQALGQSNGPNS